MSNIVKVIRDQIERLLVRKEITLLEYSFSLNLLSKTKLIQDLYNSKGGIKTLIVTHHIKVVNLMAVIEVKLPRTTKFLSLPFPTPAALSTGDTAQGVADGFSVLLNKIMEGLLPSFPEVVGLSIGVQYEESLFPGALIWLLNESDMVPTVDSRLSIWLGASKLSSDSSSPKLYSSSFLIPEGAKKQTLAKTTDNIVEWLTAEQGSVVFMACAAHVLGFEVTTIPTTRIVNTEDGGPLKRQRINK